jgi:hypothetical protein
LELGFFIGFQNKKPTPFAGLRKIPTQAFPPPAGGEKIRLFNYLRGKFVAGML